MKNYTKALLTITLGTILFTSCSKKLVSNSTFEHYRKLGQQLEMNYAISNDTIKEENHTFDAPKAVENEALVTISKFVGINILQAKYNKLAMASLKNKMVTSFEKKCNYSIDTKNKSKLNLEEKNANISPGLRNGIILGAVGLVLIIVAGFFGAAAPIVYVGGAVLFVVGLVIILLDIL